MPGAVSNRAVEAFGELVKPYQNAAIAYATAIPRNHAGAEDVAQAAFLTAWLRSTRTFVAITAAARPLAMKGHAGDRAAVVPPDPDLGSFIDSN